MLLHRLETLFIGRNFLDLPSINSTNEYALSLLSKSKPAEGTVISTSNQRAGRGQIGSSWESEPHKNIALSIILYPDLLPATQQFLLNQAISLGVFDLAENHFPGKAKIKWPNDIYINDKKVAGILIQNAIAGGHLRSSVIGIGINVNQETFTSGASNPTSFKLEKGAGFDLHQVICQLLHFVESRYLKLKSGKTVLLQSAYLECLYRFQTTSSFARPDGTTFKGRIAGVADSGKLEVAVSGKTELFGLKEIRFL